MTIMVTIKDAAALKSITVELLKKYLDKHNWTKREDLTRISAYGDKTIVGEIWSQDIGPKRQTAIIVPAHDEFADHTARMSEALMALERNEQRSQLEIFVDIMQVPISIKPKKIKKKS